MAHYNPIIDRNPTVRISAENRRRICAAAKVLGYEHSGRRSSTPPSEPYRTHEIPAKFELILLGGEVYAKGSAVIVWLLKDGATLMDLATKPSNIPIEPCYGRLRFRLGTRDMDVRCDIKWCNLERFVEFGVKFVAMCVDDAHVIERYLVQK